MTDSLTLPAAAPAGADLRATDIAAAIGLPRPTAQQVAIIEAPLAPALVIAGAGSGKTETMASRVLWLLATGQVRPGEILGLTFTRKAAGELSARIRERITQLSSHGLLPGEYDEFDPPVVATYNSFANTIYRDHALLIGREADGAVLGEASAWQLARTLVVRSTDSRLPDLEKSVDTVTKAVLALSHALSENVADTDAVREMARTFAAVGDLPSGGKGDYARVVDLARTVGALPVLLDLAEQFAHEKLRHGFVEYSDQVALALQIVRTVPKVAAEHRDRFKVVLLDEYQDTSVVQTWLLAELFRGHPVMAVGDPNQSIYGWRGASAANLEQFGGQFAQGDALHFSLSTSWRNGHGILAVANAIAQPLAAHSRVGVERLDASPTASGGRVEVVFEETLPEEADAVALWLKERLAVRGPHGKLPTAAMLFRARKTQGVFIEALRRHGVPFHVLGVGGLMAEPEIADLVCALTVIHDPNAGSELVRLLSGSRWRIGVRDLRALSRLASKLRDRDYAQRALDDLVKQRMRDSVADSEGASIVDALDFLAHTAPSHSFLTDFTEVGLTRLRQAGLTLARLRARSTLDLLDFITLVEQDFLLDIEIAANECRPLGSANLDAFFDAVNGYLAVNEIAGLGGFLSWLREAEWRDGLSPRPEDAEPGTVQLLTIHGSKGLEWDIVAVPRQVEKEMPATGREGSNGWLGFGTLPYEFRGDAPELPKFGWRQAASRKELLELKAGFKQEVTQRHELEERRLAYVAVTRARHSLLLSGSFWATHTAARGPSPFLLPLAADGILGELPTVSEFTESPLGDSADTIVWPLDPLGSRRTVLERAAELVRDAQRGHAVIADAPVPDAGPWQKQLELLLTERDRAARPARVALPARVPASRFKDYITDFEAVAGTLVRPMPQQPYRATRLGTLFHGWVEERYGIGGSSEVIDVIDSELDLATGDDSVNSGELARLQQIFEHSPWAALKPLEVEREIHLPFAGRTVVCKIDAVYFTEGRYEIVDWKTGKAPTGAADVRQRQLQLALYRLAYARWKNIDPELIDAVFYFVSDDLVVRPERLFDEAELLNLWYATVG
ncbi:ATP-dependent DNA helicase [Parafrigoribacterium mesophilum]|uniref:ATP-dependent helicase n=1 Tax=Parafrigoribacterium mesophilum TaxID=433646 RepID=UPI0031FCD4C0